MSVTADTITLETRVHLRWHAADAVEAAVWRNAAERFGARAVHFYRHEDGSGYTLTLETSVGTALTRFDYTPHTLAQVAFDGTEPQIRRLQDLYWTQRLPRHYPTDVVYN
jgi:hypothetical protein